MGLSGDRPYRAARKHVEERRGAGDGRGVGAELSS